jgi:small subunit ribosomal protein S2
MAGYDVDIKKLFSAGAHFGHKTSRWHPKMAPYIHSKREGIHIIDLTKTVECLEEALEFVESTVAQGKSVLFVGTKRQAYDAVKKVSEETDMPFVAERWLGGLLTNRNTISGRIKYLKDLEDKMASGKLEAKYSKLEVQRFQEEIDEMNKNYGGVKKMAGLPGVLVITDIAHEANAFKEAVKLNIPVVGIVDTNVNPTGVTYPVPANDDAIKTVEVILDYVKQAIANGKTSRAKHAEKADKDEKAAQAANAARASASKAEAIEKAKKASNLEEVAPEADKKEQKSEKPEKKEAKEPKAAKETKETTAKAKAPVKKAEKKSK